MLSRAGAKPGAASVRFLKADLNQRLPLAGHIVTSAMHPAITLNGVEAHFKDPDTGEEIWPHSAGNYLSDYVMAASRARFQFEHLSEHSVDEALAEYAPGVRKHLGWPLLLLARLRPTRIPPLLPRTPAS